MTLAKRMLENLRQLLPSSLENNPQRAAFLALAGCASLVLSGLWISERFLEAAIVALIWLWWRDGHAVSLRTPFLLPLGLFLAWTLIAAAIAGENPFHRHTMGKFYLLLILFVVPPIIRGAGRITWIFKAVFVVATAASLLGLAQFLADPHRGLAERITGFMSTWMNYSGQLMLVLIALAAYAFCYGLGRRWWVLFLALLIIVPLLLSLTRNAWLGAVVGLGVVILMRRPRLLLVYFALLGLIFFASPSGIRQRFISGLNPKDPNTANRIELVQTSIRLIRAHPWFGVGPNSVYREALRYRGTSSYLDWMYQHMHNNFLQIAAERGLPGLVLWLWFMGRLAWDAFSVHRKAVSDSAGRIGEPRTTEAMLASTAALGAWAALLAAGLFEYNFGISVVLIPFLFFMGCPYAFLENSGQRSFK